MSRSKRYIDVNRQAVRELRIASAADTPPSAKAIRSSFSESVGILPALYSHRSRSAQQCEAGFADAAPHLIPREALIPRLPRLRVGLTNPYFPFTASATSPLGRLGTAFKFAIMFFL